MPPADLPPEVVALAGQIERAARRTGEVEVLVQQLADDVHTLATRIANQGSSTSRVRSWFDANDPELAEIVLADLVEWLPRVYLRYQGVVLPSCWLWHPDAVEELWCLRNSHREAVSGRDASWLRLQDWQDRHRPATAQRLSAAIGACELSLHVEGGEQAGPAPVAPLADVAGVVARVWVGERGAPEPTDQQLIEAKDATR